MHKIQVAQELDIPKLVFYQVYRTTQVQNTGCTLHGNVALSRKFKKKETKTVCYI